MKFILELWTVVAVVAGGTAGQAQRDESGDGETWGARQLPQRLPELPGEGLHEPSLATLRLAVRNM